MKHLNKEMDDNVKLLAFHLPQYHEIPENNEWWGQGFTEWTNVKRGRSLYPGHYQPRVPLHKKYYDLSEKNAIRTQTELAKKFGLYGFCFYHYYFNGKKLLEKPVENYKNEPHDFPYCFAWANQSFARTWYGKDGNNQLLLEQQYGEEEQWREHFDYLLPFFKDPVYIKVNNKPMFLIYLTQDFKKCNAMIRKWNEWAQKEGFEGVYFVAMDTGYKVSRFWSKIDATVDFEPIRSIRELPPEILECQQARKRKVQENGLAKSKWKNAFRIDNVCTYKMVGKVIRRRQYQYNIDKNYLGVFTGWDNTARKNESGFVIRNSTPHHFRRLLINQIQKSKKMGNEFLFINAWNEWSEGAYLEPDEKNKYAFLKALQSAVKKTQ